MKISACVDMLYNGRDFFEGVKELYAQGINTIEFWKWTNKDIERIKNEVVAKGVKVSGFCVDSADFNDECLPKGDIKAFRSAVLESVQVAKELGADFLITTLGDNVAELSYDEQVSNIKKCLCDIIPILNDNNITLVLEPINRTERADYLLDKTEPVFEIIKEIGSDNIKLLYDVYHQDITGDYSEDTIAENIGLIGHLHFADVPGRNEPGSGKINFKKLLTILSDMGYNGCIGLEYSPKNESIEETVKKLKI